MDSFSDARFGGLDEGWDDVAPEAPIVLPDGRYAARLVRILPQDRLGQAPSAALDFEVVNGRFKGARARRFLSFANLGRAKGELALVGLGGVRPSELFSFAAFDVLPVVRITTRRVDSRGRVYVNVALVEPLPGALDGGGDPPPDPAGVAA